MWHRPQNTRAHVTVCSVFLFLYFSKLFFTKIYFRFDILQFYTPTARQGSGRDLYVNKNKFILHRGPWREPAAPLPGRGAAGSLLKYKTPRPSLCALPSAPSFSAHEIQRGERETGGVREVKKPAKPCRILDPNRR